MSRWAPPGRSVCCSENSKQFYFIYPTTFYNLLFIGKLRNCFTKSAFTRLFLFLFLLFLPFRFEFFPPRPDFFTSSHRGPVNLFGHLHRPFFLHFPPLIQFGRQTTGNKSYNTRQRRRRTRSTFSTIISLETLIAVTELRSHTNSSIPAALTTDRPPAAPASPARGTLALVVAETEPAIPVKVRTQISGE